MVGAFLLDESRHLYGDMILYLLYSTLFPMQSIAIFLFRYSHMIIKSKTPHRHFMSMWR